MNICSRIYADVGQINNCKELLASNQANLSSLAQVLDLAGNEVRLKILFLLHQEKELCPCDLSDILGMTIPAISQHLRKMKDGGLIRFRKAGQTIFYSLSDSHGLLLQPLLNMINEPLIITKA